MGTFAFRLSELVSLSALIMTGIVGALLGVVEYGVFVGLPLFAILILYAFWITANYFFEIIEFKALGHVGWPVFSLDTLVAGRNQVGVIFAALVIAAAAGYFALGFIGMDSGAKILLGAGFVLLPSSAALLAVTREFSAALNPVRVVAAAVGMGHAYLYCLAGAVLLIALIGAAEARGGLWYFPLVYGFFAQAYLTGSIVYARRTELGVHAPRSPEALADRATAEAIARRQAVLSLAYGFASHDNRTGALKHIDSYVAAEDDTLEARLWMLNEAARWENNDVALELGKRAIDYCEQHGFAEEAARVRLKCEYLMAHRRPIGDRDFMH